MNVSEALASRMSCRAFLPTPVPEATVRAILDGAKQSPSGGNLQPWRVYALSGEPLKEFLALIRSRIPMHPRGEGSEYEIYPTALWEPYRSRRFKCGEDLYATIGVAREDKLTRLLQFARNYEFFGAPVGLFFCLDRRMGPPQWSDLGMYMQSVMLLAREHGLPLELRAEDESLLLAVFAAVTRTPAGSGASLVARRAETFRLQMGKPLRWTIDSSWDGGRAAIVLELTVDRMPARR